MNELSSGEPPHRTGLVIVTHNLRDAVKVSERFLFLHQRIICDGDLDSLKASTHPEIQRFVRESFVSPTIDRTSEKEAEWTST
jgi:ABC-type transporter Mla maintaining outer membrane lipid asymmetry ATPase subunit MlaF